MEKVEIADESAGVDCDVCGSPMVYKMGRFGKFIACSNFPQCRNTKAIVKHIGVTCPRCHEGNIVERKSKKKRMFYGCDRFPTCDFVSWDKPINRPCPKCGGMLVEKKGKRPCTFNVHNVNITNNSKVRRIPSPIYRGGNMNGSNSHWSRISRK